MKKLIYILTITFLIINNGYGQKENLKNISNESEREEIQRYFGYENLIESYITLPFDISTNTNERGYFIEIGFILVILLPILILWNKNLRTNWRGKALFAIFFLFQLIYISTGYILDNNNVKISHGNFSAYAANNNSLVENILSQFYIIGNNIISPISNLLEKFSDKPDYITYPFLSILFTFLFALVNGLKIRFINKAFTLFLLAFSFYWLILCSGILWYGYLGLILAVILVLKLISFLPKSYEKLLLTFISIWVICAIVTRISFVYYTSSINDNTGKFIIHPTFFQRSLGIINSIEATDKIHPGLSLTQELINNSEQSDLIYSIGTGLDYFFNGNQERIFKDNQLRMFNVVFERFRTKDKINQALKSAGFRYLIVDLNTHTLDKTPEKTLTEKFKRLLNYIYQNPQLTLIGTDRRIKGTDNQKYQFGVYGDIVQSGSYAVYRIN